MAFTLSADNKVTIGTALTVIGVCVSCAVWGVSKLNVIESRLAAVEGGKYNLTTASEQALRLAIENPGMRVPDPRDPAVIIEVRARSIEGRP